MDVTVNYLSGSTYGGDASREPQVTVTRKDVEARGGFGMTVAVVDVTDGPAKTGRFWMSVYIKNGRPVCRITTQTQADDKSVKTTGTWRDFRHPDDK